MDNLRALIGRRYAKVAILHKYVAVSQKKTNETPTPQPFYGPFFRTSRVSRCQKRTSGLHGARED